MGRKEPTLPEGSAKPLRVHECVGASMYVGPLHAWGIRGRTSDMVGLIMIMLTFMWCLEGAKSTGRAAMLVTHFRGHTSV